jgi:putative transposase
MADQLANARKIRLLTLVDNFSRDSPAISVDYALKSEHVIQTLEQYLQEKGKPDLIQIDNGSEFTSKALDIWAFSTDKPTDNPFIESFKGRVRQECLNQHGFSSLEEARSVLETWRKQYNTERPHRSLGKQTPLEFLKEFCLNEIETQNRKS